MAEPVFSTSLNAQQLTDYVDVQMENLFPDGAVGEVELLSTVAVALERLEHCFLHNRMKCYWDDKGPRFNHRHTDQYAVFLYYLSHAAFKAEQIPAAEKAYALNKALHGLDAFYEVVLPDVFALQHPVGTVLGRATYANYFVAYQNVTVGDDTKGNQPVFGEGVVLYGGARVIGGARIGANCFISTGALVLGDTVGNDHVAYGQYPKLTAKPTARSVKRDIFRIP